MLLSLRERIIKMQNKHIKEFLNYYIGLPNPQYAVLLKGKWGSGKTHFINEYKKEYYYSAKRLRNNPKIL